MRIIAKRTLREFWEVHTNCEQQLLSWYKITKNASWDSFEAVKAEFGTCKIVGSDRVIFKIKGNHYRLIVKVSFIHQTIWIKFIGTHDEYDSIDPKTI